EWTWRFSRIVRHHFTCVITRLTRSTICSSSLHVTKSGGPVIWQDAEHFCAVRRHEHIVLDSDAPPSGKIYAWFYSHHHAFLQTVVGFGTQGRPLVHF